MRVFIVPGHEWPDTGPPGRLLMMPCHNKATAHWYKALADYGIFDDFYTAADVQHARVQAKNAGVGVPPFYVVVAVPAIPFRC